jgi:tetratricopeptide (TPR) repeat protein
MRSRSDLGGTRDVTEARRVVAGALLLLTLTLLAYAPVFQSGFIWDDDSYVTENDTLRSLDGLRRIWLVPRSIPQYYPVVHTTFWLEYQLWGLAPTGFHVVNVLLHVLNAVLVWVILRRLFQRTEEGLDVPILALGATWLAAAVFALHPVHVESVAWITERKNVLSGAFYLGSMLVLLPVFGIGNRGIIDLDRSHRSRARYVLGVLLFVAALLSKSVTFSLPAALLLLVYWKRGRITGREVAMAAPMLAVGAAAGLYTAFLERVHVGAQHVDWGLSVADRLLIAGRAIVFYAGKLLWPYPLIFSYPRWEIDAGQAWQWLFPIGVLASLLLLYLARGRWGRGPLVAVLFFVGTLFPALGFIDVYPMVFSFVADHFQYLASLGIIALVILGGAVWLRAHRSWRTWIGYSISVLVLGGLLSLTFLQALVYWDAETLWRTTIAANARSWMAMDNLAELLSEQARGAASPAEAARYRDEATRWRERSLELHQDWLAYEGLAQMRLQAGRFEEAVTLFERSLELAPDNASARLNLSTALGQLGREREQMEQLEWTLALEPEMIVALRPCPRIGGSAGTVAAGSAVVGDKAERVPGCGCRPG